MNKTERERITAHIREDHPYIVVLRRHFHRHPEIAKEEFHTAERIEAELDKIGLVHRRVGETGVYAEIQGKKPGKTLVTPCRYRCPAYSRDAYLRIYVKYSGTNACLRARCSYGVSYWCGTDSCCVPIGSVVVMPGPNNASVDWFKITVHSAPAHVSTPQLGVDAVYIASQIVVALQALVTRCTSPMDNVLIGVGKVTAGDAYNIIAQKAEPTAIEAFGQEHVITQRKPSLGGDDFAEYILKVPGVYAYIGSGNAARKETTVAHHDSMFDIDEDCLTTAVTLYVLYTLDYLTGAV